MSINNIYYLDQFTQNIYKTDSDQTTTITIENVASLAGTEGLINLQTDSATNFYLFGDTAEVYTRPVDGDTWTKILDLTTQSSLLSIASGDANYKLGTLNILDSKIRCPFVTPDGNIYIAYSPVNNLDSGVYNVSVLHYTGGTSWELLVQLPQEQFVGFADLFDSTIALKTTSKNQNYSHCNKITTIHGSTLSTILAPGTGVRPLISPIFDANVSDGININILYQTILPSGEMILLTVDKLIRVSTSGVITSYAMAASSGLTIGNFGAFGTITGNYLVFYTGWETPQTTSYKYTVISLVSNTITHTGNWTISNATFIQAIGLNNNTVLIMSNNASGSCYIFDVVAYTQTATTSHVNTGLSNIVSSYILSSTNDMIMSIPGISGLAYFNITNATWTIHTTSPAIYAGNAFYVLGDGTFMVGISGYNYGIYNPATFTITQQYTMTPVGNDYSAPTLGGTYPTATVASGTDLYILSSFYHCIYKFSSGTYSRLEFVDLQHDTRIPSLAATLGLSVLDSNTIEMKFFDIATGRVNASTISYTLTDTIPAVSNIQGITGISLNELYCVGLKGFSDGMFSPSGGTVGINGVVGDYGDSGTYSDPNSLDFTSYIYKWNGSSWSVLYTISDPDLILNISNSNTNQAQYFPFLMSCRYNSSSALEIVMLRDTPDTVFLYTNGTITTAVMEAVPDSQNIFNGTEAPSIPFVANQDLSAAVPLAVISGGDVFPAPFDAFTDYAQARLVYRSDLGLYCLIRNNEFYYTTIFPANYTSAAIPVSAGKSYYLSLPISTDATVNLQGNVGNVNSHLTATIENMSNTEMDIKIDVASGVNNSTGVMTITPEAAIGGAFTGTSAASQIISFIVPPTPAAKYYPQQVDNPTQFQTLYKSETTLYCTSSLELVSSTDSGTTWTVLDTFTPPAYNYSGSNWTTAEPILSICENSTIGAIATSIAGIQKPNSFWKSVSAFPGSPVPSGTLPSNDVPYASATVIALPYNAAGSITTESPVYGNTYCNVYRFDLTQYSAININVTNGTSWQAYTEIYNLIGSPSNYTSTYITDQYDNGNGTDINPTISIELNPGSYYFVISGDLENGPPAVATGSYTLQISATGVAGTPVSVEQLVYNGTQYIALTGPTNNDYQTNIGYSTDLVNFTLFTDPNTGLAYTNPNSVYFPYNTLHVGANGTTMACLGSLVLKISSAGVATVPTGISGQSSNGEQSSFATDGSGNWIMSIQGGNIYSSSNDGNTWTDITSTVHSIYTSHSVSTTIPLFIEYVNSKFIIMGVIPPLPGTNMNVIQSTSVNFSTGITFYGNVTTNALLGYSSLKAVGTTLVMTTTDHVVVSTNSGQTWA